MKLCEPINFNDLTGIKPENFLDFQELNLNKELSFPQILEKLKSIIIENENWYEETTVLRECMTNLRKITCRQLKRDNNLLIENNIHILLFKILEYFQSYHEYTELEQTIIVNIYNKLNILISKARNIMGAN
jgi:hypothetical protein